MIDSLILPVAFVAGTDATDDVYIHNPYGESVVVTDIDIMPETSVATHAANYITTTVSIGGTTVASHTTNSSGGSALTAGTVLAMTLSGTTKQLEMAAGATMRIVVTKAGTGPAYANQMVVVAKQTRV